MIKVVAYVNYSNTFLYIFYYAFESSILTLLSIRLAFLNSQEATHLIDQLVESLATNDNEAKCEQECHVLITNQDSVFQHLCPFMCHSYVF